MESTYRNHRPPNAPLPDWLEEVPGEIVARVLVPVELPGRAVRANVTIDEGLLARLDAAAAAEGRRAAGSLHKPSGSGSGYWHQMTVR